MAAVEANQSDHADRYWFSWRDAHSGESYGESNLYAVACELARRLSQEPLVEGRPQDVDLYEEPASRLLARYRAGQSEAVAEPTVGQDPTPRRGRPSSRGGPALSGADRRRLAQLVHDRDEIAARRLAAGLPADAWRVRYLVVEDKATGAALSWGEEDEAQALAAEARAKGHDVQLRESIDWTLLEPGEPKKV